MGLRDAIRRAASGGYEAPSSRTACEACLQPYTAADPMVQVKSAVPGETWARIHRSHLSDPASAYYTGRG